MHWIETVDIKHWSRRQCWFSMHYLFLLSRLQVRKQHLIKCWGWIQTEISWFGQDFLHPTACSATKKPVYSGDSRGASVSGQCAGGRRGCRWEGRLWPSVRQEEHLWNAYPLHTFVPGPVGIKSWPLLSRHAQSTWEYEKHKMWICSLLTNSLILGWTKVDL